MTTKLAYQIQSVINYDQLSFNPDNPDAPEPLPDAMYQYPILQEVLHILDTHVAVFTLRKRFFAAATLSSATTRTT